MVILFVIVASSFSPASYIDFSGASTMLVSHGQQSSNKPKCWRGNNLPNAQFHFSKCINVVFGYYIRKTHIKRHDKQTRMCHALGQKHGNAPLSLSLCQVTSKYSAQVILTHFISNSSLLYIYFVCLCKYFASSFFISSHLLT